jgi:hypothetical protein
MSSSTTITPPRWTALTLDQPARAATVCGDCPQHLVSAREHQVRLAFTITSADSCGYWLLAVEASAMFFSPAW